jgi:glycyl-tRNA synthetase beta chain
MTAKASDLLLEIGCEELPASFVDAANAALPELAKKKLDALRLPFTKAYALGTPRRLALIVEGLATAQADLDEVVTGPPVSAAFKDGKPTRAAEAFAQKLGIAVEALTRAQTPKGEYLAGARKEAGREARALLPDALAQIISEIPFRKSMRWADLEVAFGRPIQWLVAILGDEVLPVSWGGLRAGRTSRGHRFLVPTGAARGSAPVSIDVPNASAYVAKLREAHVLVDQAERKAAMRKALDEASKLAGGSWIEDEFLIEENASLVEEPHVVVGSFEEVFLDLPERLILEVAKGHQRYFGLRGPTGRLLPKYLTVVNTALAPEKIAKGNDRVMRARLADARFFWETDRAIKLEAREPKLEGIVFQKRLGTVLAKVKRIEQLVRALGPIVGLDAATVEVAAKGARLAKCDLVALMVGEFPELQGEMGHAYAVAEGVAADVADVIRDHYRPKGANDETATAPAGALVAIADRLDTLAGCFAIGLSPTGAADPYALRRACLGVLRTILDRGWALPLDRAFGAAFDGFEGVKLDLGKADLVDKLTAFTTDRLRGLLEAQLPADAVRAALGAAWSHPGDARARAEALAGLDAATRAQLGEVFKRAANIAEKTEGEGGVAVPPRDVHASETALVDAVGPLAKRIDASAADYAALLRDIAATAPLMAKYFEDVFVMSDDAEVRAARLGLMRAIATKCGRIARLELLAS